MEKIDMEKIDIELNIEISDKPEGYFYVTTVVSDGETVVGMARTKPISVAICLDNLAKTIRNKHYDKKRSEG